jgi:TonB-linked SusC/RagA family outer membrane protein
MDPSTHRLGESAHERTTRVQRPGCRGRGTAGPIPDPRSTREEVPVHKYCLSDNPLRGLALPCAALLGPVRSALRGGAILLIVSAAAAGLAYQPAAAQQTGVITGVVRSEAGTLLSGAKVELDTGQGTLTANNGRFMLRDVAAGSHEVSVTLIGYATAEQTVDVPAGGVVTVDFTLLTEAVALEELVVVGYATQSERNISGAVAKVTAEELQPVAATSVNQMLSGKAAGLNLTTRSAQPGGGVTVNVRGAISSGNNEPLYVIDGVPITEFDSSMPGLATGILGYYGGIDRDPLAYLNPSDIESVTVLKDASAAAIYGSAAANGVVLITTKSGQQGAVQWRYGFNYSAKPTHEYFPLLSARDFMAENRRLSYDQWLWDNDLPPYGDADPADADPYVPLFTEADVQSAGAGTDWIDLVTRDGQIMEHNLSVSGGTEATTAYVSFNYRTEDGALKTSTFDKYTGRVNLDQRLGESTRMGLRLAGTLMEGSNASTGSNSGGAEKYNMLQAAYEYAPTIPIYDENGEYAFSYYTVLMNPAAFLTITDDAKTTTLFAAGDFEQDLLPNLTLTVTGEWSQEGSDRGFYLPRGTNNTNLPDGAAQKATAKVLNYGSEGYLTYRGRVGDGDLQVVGGAGIYKAGEEGSSMQGVGFTTDAFTYNNIGTSIETGRNTIASYKSARTKLSQFARLNYTFRDRYIFSALARRDGSSIFAENHKYGIFPGASAAWIMSDEPFFDALPDAISFLKLRAGYGEAGNESILSGNSLQLYNSGYPFLIGNTEYSGVAITQVANPDLTWETVKTANLGLDFELFNDRIHGSFDVFQKTAEDRLAFNPLPSNNAVGRVADNVGTTRSRGFEVTLGGSPIQRSNFRWDANFNMSHSVGYWVERNPITVLDPWESDDDPMDVIWGWETDGIIQTEADRPAHMPDANLGNIIFVDQNGDGELNEDDVVDLGNSQPRWRFGVDSRITYAGFSLYGFVYAHTGYVRGNSYNPSMYNIRQYTVPANTTIYAKDFWSHDHPEGTLPGVANNPYAQNAPAGNDFNLYDASFIRLRNIALSYQVPQRLLSRIGGADNLRLVVDLQDLGVLTDYPGFDPEFTEPNPYPKAYTVTFGAEVGF